MKEELLMKRLKAKAIGEGERSAFRLAAFGLTKRSAGWRVRCSPSPLAFASIIALSSILYPLSVISAVPLTWQVDTTRVAPVTFDAYHGETLELEAVFKAASRPLDLTGKTASLYWQTNGMESVYWATNATVAATNHIAATFTGAMDPGASSVRGFLGIAGENYRAAFVIRFRPSPGFEPGMITKPPQILDFRHTEVVNPPWPTKADYAATTTVMRAELKSYIDSEIEGAGVITPTTVTNIVDAKIAAIPKDGVRTNAVNFIIGEAVNTNWLCTVAAANEKLAEAKSYTRELTSERAKLISNGNYKEFEGLESPLAIGYGLTVHDSWLTVENWQIRASDETLDEHISEMAYPAADGNQLAASVATIAAHLNAEDARFVVTNYDSATRTPEAYVEIKVSNDWLRVWSEARRWNALETWKTNVTAQLGNKAERAWGIYDSETGGYSPDGYTQISSSNILIASGMAYQRTVTPFNSLWVLQCNQGSAQLGGDTNGYFRIKDGDGNTQFEIVKGNRIELGADASGITVQSVISTSLITIPYSVVANEHPTLQICTDLSAGNWKAEGEAGCPATVSWTGTSGAYVAHVTAPNNLSQMFFKATYLGGSDTIINNNAPVKMQYIYIGNSKYAIGYATINGTGVMTLTPAN